MTGLKVRGLDLQDSIEVEGLVFFPSPSDTQVDSGRPDGMGIERSKVSNTSDIVMMGVSRSSSRAFGRL